VATIEKNVLPVPELITFSPLTEPVWLASTVTPATKVLKVPVHEGFINNDAPLSGVPPHVNVGVRATAYSSWLLESDKAIRDGENL
jgi:hypothetical protein